MAASHYSGMLPDPLRLKLGGLQPLQLQVYEDFSRVRTLQIQAGTLPPHPIPVCRVLTDACSLSEEQRLGAAPYSSDSPALAAAQAPSASDPAVPTVLSGPQAMEKFAVRFFCPCSLGLR